MLHWRPRTADTCSSFKWLASNDFSIYNRIAKHLTFNLCLAIHSFFGSGKTELKCNIKFKKCLFLSYHCIKSFIFFYKKNSIFIECSLLRDFDRRVTEKKSFILRFIPASKASQNPLLFYCRASFTNTSPEWIPIYRIPDIHCPMEGVGIGNSVECKYSQEDSTL